MYVIRRVWVTKPGEARRAATLVNEIGRLYEEAGKRSPSRVYFNSGTIPGDKNRVYMEWTETAIESPYRTGQVTVAAAGDLGARLREITEETWIEFYEMMTAEKALDIE